MLYVLALLISLAAASVSPADVIGGGGPGYVPPTPAPVVSPADVIGGGGPGVIAPTPAPLDVIGGGGPG